jgi:hypothetical protein
MPTHIAFIYSIDQSLLIAFIKRRFLVNRTLVWRWWRFLCARVVEWLPRRRDEEAGVAAAVKETGSSSIDGSGGDWQSRERIAE